MVVVIRDSDRSCVRVHVNHLDTELLLQVAALPMYPDGRFPTWVYSLAVFLHLDKSNTVLVHDNEIDRGRVLARGKDPVPQAHKMLGTDQLAKVAVNVTRVRCIRQSGSSRRCGPHVCLPGRDRLVGGALEIFLRQAGQHQPELGKVARSHIGAHFDQRLTADLLAFNLVDLGIALSK